MPDSWLSRIPNALKAWLAIMGAVVAFLQLLLKDVSLVLFVCGTLAVVSGFLGSLWVIRASKSAILDSSARTPRFSTGYRRLAALIGVGSLIGAVLLARSAPARRTAEHLSSTPVRIDHASIGYRDSSTVVGVLIYNAGQREAVVTDVSLDISSVTEEGTCTAYVEPVEFAFADRLAVVARDSTGFKVEGLAERRVGDVTSYRYRGTLRMTGCPDHAQVLLDVATVVPAGAHEAIAFLLPDSVQAIQLPATRLDGTQDRGGNRTFVWFGKLLKVKRYSLKVTAEVVGQATPATYGSGELWKHH
jgi:hypothetical protein